MFVWRSNLLGSSGKGHEYFLKHLLGTQHGVQGKELGGSGEGKPVEVAWRDEAPEGKFDLLVTLDFRMSATCLYSDIMLPTAIWYEKNDLNISDMHPFIHPLSAAVGPVWESRSDWEIFKGIAKKFSEVAAAAVKAVIEREVDIPAPEETECRRHFDNNPSRFRSPDLVEAAHILLPASPDDEEQRAPRRLPGNCSPAPPASPA